MRIWGSLNILMHYHVRPKQPSGCNGAIAHAVHDYVPLRQLHLTSPEQRDVEWTNYCRSHAARDLDTLVELVMACCNDSKGKLCGTSSLNV